MTVPKIHTGTSSFQNRLWQPRFYPMQLPGAQWFEHYCKHFNTYEINATFYKSPTIKTLQNWYKKSPEGFLFSVKAPQEITHTKKFIDIKNELHQFYETCKAGMQEKLACILFQFPPSFKFSEERLAALIQHLDSEFKNVIEFRDISWWRRDVYDAFTEAGIIFCNVSYPNLPENIITTSDIGYLRLHGNQRLFYSGYSYTQLEDYLIAIEKTNVSAFYVYFNNTAGIEGIDNALLFNRAGEYM